MTKINKMEKWFYLYSENIEEDENKIFNRDCREHTWVVCGP